MVPVGCQRLCGFRGRLIDIQKKVIPNFPVYILGPFGVRLKTTTDAKGEFKISIEFVSSNPKKESQQAPTWVFWYPRVTAKSDTQCPWDLWSRASSSAGFEEQGGSHGRRDSPPGFWPLLCPPLPCRHAVMRMHTTVSPACLLLLVDI